MITNGTYMAGAISTTSRQRQPRMRIHSDMPMTIVVAITSVIGTSWSFMNSQPMRVEEQAGRAGEHAHADEHGDCHLEQVLDEVPGRTSHDNLHGGHLQFSACGYPLPSLANPHPFSGNREREAH